MSTEPDHIAVVIMLIIAALMFIIGLICNERDERATDEHRPLTAREVAAYALKESKR